MAFWKKTVRKFSFCVLYVKEEIVSLLWRLLIVNTQYSQKRKSYFMRCIGIGLMKLLHLSILCFLNSLSPSYCWLASCCQDSSSHTSQDEAAPGRASRKKMRLTRQTILSSEVCDRKLWLLPFELLLELKT